MVSGGHRGNPNPVRQQYLCQTCGAPRPPYQFYCDRHVQDAHHDDDPLLIDRLMHRLLGHGPTDRASSRVRSHRGLATAVGLDVFVVVLFVAIGRRNHDEDPGLLGVLATAAPFLIGLTVAWALVRAWRRPARITTGLAIWPVTVLGGMIARRLVFGEGTATSFVIVATLFLGAGLVGWRAARRAVERRRPSRALSSPAAP